MDDTDFPESEYALRTERAQTAMRSAGLDALFFTTEAEVRYFSGFRTLFWQSPTRPWFLVVLANGKPIAVIPQIGAHLMATTWLSDIRTFSAPHPVDDGIGLLADVLAKHPRIGMPMGRESALRMPLDDFRALQGRLPGAEFVNASNLVQGLRQVKSELELDKLRTICRIGSAGFAAAPNLFRPGQSLKDAFRAFRVELLNQGADDVPYLVGGAGQAGYSDVISPPTDQPLLAGDVLMLDTGATKDGYFCDFDRNFAIGYATDTVKCAHETLVAAVDAAVKNCKTRPNLRRPVPGDGQRNRSRRGRCRASRPRPRHATDREPVPDRF